MTFSFVHSKKSRFESIKKICVEFYLRYILFNTRHFACDDCGDAISIVENKEMIM